MTLERNLIDNILECEAKLGYADLPICFYYPKSSLTELLECKENEMSTAIQKFQKDEITKLGEVTIRELDNEKGRYEATVPLKGVQWVHENYKPTEFTIRFVGAIKIPGNTLEDIERLFKSFSSAVDIRKVSSSEWSICFENEEIDPYIYHIEKNLFGLEYHRFTRAAYDRMGISG